MDVGSHFSHARANFISNSRSAGRGRAAIMKAILSFGGRDTPSSIAGFCSDPVVVFGPTFLELALVLFGACLRVTSGGSIEEVLQRMGWDRSHRHPRRVVVAQEAVKERAPA